MMPPEVRLGARWLLVGFTCHNDFRLFWIGTALAVWSVRRDFVFWSKDD